MATVAVNGGNGLARVVAAMARRGQERGQRGESETSKGSGRHRREGPRRRGGLSDAGRQGGAWRRGRACAVSLLCPLAEVGDDWHGPGGPARPGKWPVALLSLSLSFHIACFSIFLQLFWLY